MSDTPQTQPPSPVAPAGSVTVTFDYTFALFMQGQRLHRMHVSRWGQALYVAWFRVIPVLALLSLVWAGLLFHRHNDAGYFLVFLGLVQLLLFVFSRLEISLGHAPALQSSIHLRLPDARRRAPCVSFRVDVSP